MSAATWDHDALHWLFWERRIDDNTVQIRFPQTGAEFGVSKVRIVHLVNQMIKDGRLSKTGVGGTYFITNPATWEPPTAA